MTDWRSELRSLLSPAGSLGRSDARAPDRPRIRSYLTDVVAPALEAVAVELQELGRDVEIDLDERHASIHVVHDGREEFFYEIRVRPYGAEQFSFPAVPLRDPEGKTYRAEARLRERALERDVTNATRDELIQSFLDEYRRHLEWHT